MTPDSLKIGSLTIENNLILAPLAGITNLPLRLLAKEAGCGLVFSEMISANALFHRTPKHFASLKAYRRNDL
jgi:tRNA-dihydrouridine synthase